MNSIDSINGMTHAEATKLRRARVRTTTTFLQIASTRSGRALLTKETGINSPKLLLTLLLTRLTLLTPQVLQRGRMHQRQPH